MRSYDRAAGLRLLLIARGRAGHTWEVRREAALMLQRQLLLLPPSRIAEHDFWFVKLALKRRKGIDLPLNRDVLREGFRARDVKEFVGEWRRRLKRPAGLLQRSASGQCAVRWQYLAQGEYRVFLARYLFSPEEVVNRVLSRVRVSKGEELPFPQDSDLIQAEARLAAKALPKYEARILKLLCDPSKIYWVSEQPDTAVNSLVAYPPGTVVLVVKPPGSCVEFEIKRAGTPSSRPLSVKFEQNGEEVPPSHRLQGGSLGWHLRFEGRAGARFSRIYRTVHGRVPAIAVTHGLKSIHTLPTAKGERPIIEFLSSRELFGDGFEAMRGALRHCVRAAFDADDYGVPDLPGELGRTMNFLIQAWPGQVVQSGTSSFRLDRLAEYLSPDGAKRYFGVSLEQHAEPDHAHELADQLFEEILGDFARPHHRSRSYSRYLTEVFAMNRRRADHVFLALLRELGTFWGTLATVKGYTNGESFVSRNIGLRSEWSGAQWHVGLRFMDQDDLHLPDPSQNDFSPNRLLKGMLLDQKYVSGSEKRPNPKSSLFALTQIYRVTPQIHAAGLLVLKQARTSTVKKTRTELKRNIPLRDHFSPTFLRKSLECDRLWAAYSRERERIRMTPALIDQLLKRIYPDAPDGGRIKQHAKALRESAEHFFLNPNT
ncbi:MAG: hypothetical protein DME97_05195 [Verrucomicrobia bacterium]|nr:MAG: hypothetical protein DME97_05195 [Verrucomicrobiota bacterium]